MEKEQIISTDENINQQANDIQPGGTDESAVVAGGNENGSSGVADENGMDIDIPENWEQPLKDFLNSISDPAGKKAIFDKVKNFDSGYQKKLNDVATQRKELEAERAAFSDERQLLGAYAALEKQFRDSGISPDVINQFGSVPNYLRFLHENNMRASQNPAHFIIDFCRAKGIDSVEKLEELLTGDEANSRRQELNAAEFESQMMKRVEERFAIQNATNEINAFANDGNHPLFENVRQTMATMLRSFPNITLQEAYDLAVYKDPELRAQQNLAAEKARQEEVKADVAKAKAASGITQAPQAKITQPESWEDILAKGIEEQNIDD